MSKLGSLCQPSKLPKMGIKGTAFGSSSLVSPPFITPFWGRKHIKQHLFYHYLIQVTKLQLRQSSQFPLTYVKKFVKGAWLESTINPAQVQLRHQQAAPSS